MNKDQKTKELERREHNHNNLPWLETGNEQNNQEKDYAGDGE